MNEVIVSESGGTRLRLRDGRYEVGHGRSWEPVEEAWPALLPLLKRSPADGLATVAALKGPPFLWRELLRLALEWETGSWHERAVPWLAALCLEPEGSLRVAAQRAVDRTAGSTAPPAAHSLAPGQGETIEAVHYQDYVMCYCPQEQTGGNVLKDRRLSRLLKQVPAAESETLLAAKWWGPALVSAIAELEAALRDDAGLSPDDAVSLAKLLRAPALPIDSALRERLRRWVTMRNRHVHKHVDVAPLSARCAVSDVRRAIEALEPHEG